MVVNGELQELLANSVRRFVEHHRSEFDALQCADGPAIPGILGNAVREAGTLGWLGALTESNAAEEAADDESFTRLLATLVHGLGRACPAFALRLLTHHYARACVLGAPPAEHPLALDPSRNEWLGAEATLSDSRCAPTLRLAQLDHGTRLSGGVRFVVGGDVAPLWLIRARGVEGVPSLVLLRRDAALKLDPVATLGLAGMGAVDADFAEPGTMSFEVVAAGEAVPRCLARANRSVGLAYLALMQELVEQSLSIARSHALIRRQNGTQLAQIPAVAGHLRTLERAVALLRTTTHSYDSHCNEAWTALPALIHAAQTAADGALQVLGGAGYIVGHGAERCWRDVLQLGQLFASDPW